MLCQLSDPAREGDTPASLSPAWRRGPGGADARLHGRHASGKIRITSLEPSRRLECFERQLRVEPREGVRQPPLPYDDAVVGSLLAWSAGADVGAVRGLPAKGRQPAQAQQSRRRLR